MTVFHRHHKIPRHAGGTDDPDNIEILTVGEHAEAHKKLYEQFGRWQDLIAWRFLSGQITSSEADLEANRLRGLGVPKSPEHRRKLSEYRVGKKLPDSTKEAMRKAQTGRKHPESVKKKIGTAHKGRKHSPEMIAKYILSRQKTDGTVVVIDGRTFGSHSQAASSMSEVWGISKERARRKLRAMSGYVPPCRRK